MTDFEDLKATKKEDIIKFIKESKEEYLNEVNKLFSNLTCYDLVKFLVWKNTKIGSGILKSYSIEKITEEVNTFFKDDPTLRYDLVPIEITSPSFTQQQIKEALLQLYNEHCLMISNLLQDICKSPILLEQNLVHPSIVLNKYKHLNSYFWKNNIGVEIKPEDLI